MPPEPGPSKLHVPSTAELASRAGQDGLQRRLKPQLLRRWIPENKKRYIRFDPPPSGRLRVAAQREN